jgi:hypothetical protein
MRRMAGLQPAGVECLVRSGYGKLCQGGARHCQERCMAVKAEHACTQERGTEDRTKG